MSELPDHRSFLKQARFEAHCRTQTRYGVNDFKGRQTGQQHVQAVRAAGQGDAASQGSLRTMYFIGEGVRKNYGEAIKWWLTAAAQGNPVAQLGLGMIYRQGYGVPQNFILAYMWSYVVVLAHDPDFEDGAKADLEKIAPHMAPSQIAEAQSLARQCLQSNYADCNQAPLNAR